MGFPTMLNDFDLEVLQELRFYANQPRALISIATPAFTSITMSMVMLLSYDSLITILWPGHTVQPAINTAIACFLAPAGLVYALSFGFVFQQTLIKHHTILEKVTQELSYMDQMLTMTTKLKLPSNRHAMALYKAIKSELIFMGMLVQDREVNSFKHTAPKNIKVHVWDVIDILRDAAITMTEENFDMNSVIFDKILQYLVTLNNICTDRMGTLHTKIHPFKWIFLEILGSLTLFGVMLISAQSRGMILMMCELTMFSTSMLCYVMADYDSPFNGFFRIDLSILPEVIVRTDELYTELIIKDGRKGEGRKGSFAGSIDGKGRFQNSEDIITALAQRGVI